ncbi:hypothetical protein ACFFU9_07785 [Mariniflexile ostreae]|uniref:Uncharacterized protein n=1 Tax=Mariniflexile ostreae TaxID=1520892 RepID=A0ABV5FB33_9FLAO
MLKKATLFCVFCLFTSLLQAHLNNTATKLYFGSTSVLKHKDFSRLDSILDSESNQKTKDYNKSFEISSNSSHEFTWEYIEKWYPSSDSIAKDISKAAEIFKAIEEGGFWIDSFGNEDMQELPIGVKHLRENIDYALCITQAIINKDYTELTVFARVRIPQINKEGLPFELFFGANNVKLSHKGGIIGDANLVLLGDVNIPFNSGNWMLSLKGGFDYKSGEIDSKTFVTIDCDGVKEMGIQGVVEFSRALILPIEESGEVDEKKTTETRIFENESGKQTAQVPYRVKGEFNLIAKDWNDLLVDIDLQPFVLAKKRNNKDYKGNFQFAINKAILDFSDLRNDAAVEFPEYYQENGLLLPTENSWRGIYVNSVQVKMPSEFLTSNNLDKNKRVEFGAHHLLIDNYGVSGSFYADNLFSLKEGITNKEKAWAYSIDYIEVDIVANNLASGKINGQILLPISKEENETDVTTSHIGLKYKGTISEEEYIFNVSNDSIIDFNLWKAKGELDPNSTVELTVSDGHFKPKATLHGRLAISISQKESLEKEGEELATGITNNGSSLEKNFIEFKGIEFKNLVLQTESPVFKVGSMGYHDEVAIAGFPVSISNIDIISNEFNTNLKFDLAVNLMGEDNGFAARTSLEIKGAFKEENYKQKWKFNGVDMNAINVDADLGGLSIIGELNLMRDDPEYGDGFSADLTAKFKSIGIEAKAKGVFGKTDFRYWQFEAMVDGFSVGTGFMNLSGFAGGASYRMKRKGFSSNFSPTGIGYTPAQDVGLGLKAMVMFNMVKDQVIKGSAGFEIAFDKNTGGVTNMGFYGQATFLGVEIPGLAKISDLVDRVKLDTDIAKKFLEKQSGGEDTWVGKNLMDKAETNFPQTPPGDSMAISAKMGITYDFQNEVLHGELDASINTPGGFLTGGGKSTLHFDSKNKIWYIYIGTPEQRIEIGINVGPVSVNTGGYFMVGSVLPASPGPDPKVASILGLSTSELDYMRNENAKSALSNGGGVAFGANITVDTGDLRFLMFYASLQAGTSFDIMLKNYQNAQCVNTGDQVGINGWYANGQAYAYLQGELGINVKLFLIKKKIPIIKGAAAAILQTKAPNPVWMRGYIGGNFSLLGGLVKGRFRFKVILGEECEFEHELPLGGIKIIAGVTPENAAKEIDVFAIPQASFNMKVGVPVVIQEDEGDKTYRIDLEEFVLLNDGVEIPSKLEWSPYNDNVNLVATDILPGDKELTIRVKVSFKEKTKGIFKPMLIDGQLATEMQEVKFTTGGAPNYIPLSNIVLTYPVVNQKYFLEEESNQGYIQLKRGQDYLFDDAAWESFIKYKEMDAAQSSHVEFNYDTANNILRYSLPKLSQETKYSLQVASKPKGSTTTISNNTDNNQPQTSTKTESTYDNSDADTNINIKDNKAENVSKDGEIERLAYLFSTSKYKTFEKKINSIDATNYGWRSLSSDVIYLNNKIKDHEPFDTTELLGTNYSNNTALVSIEATLDDDYFLVDLNPPLYSKYPFEGKYTITNRNPIILGTPPKNALPLISNYLTNLEYEVNEKDQRTTFPFLYNLGVVYKTDWMDLRNQIVNAQTDGKIPNNSPTLNFLDDYYKFMRYGFYNTTLKYTLPDGKIGTSVIYKFKNTNNFR